MSDSFKYNQVDQKTFFTETITTGIDAEIVANDNINSLKQLFVRWSDDKLNIVPGPAIIPGLITDEDEEVTRVFDIGHDTREFRTVYTNSVEASGTIKANQFVGNGSALTGIVSSYGDKQVKDLLPTYTGNLVSLTGHIQTTGNVAADHITTTSNIHAQGNIRGAHLNTFGTVSATGTVTAGNLRSSGSVNCSELVCSSNATIANLTLLGSIENNLTINGNIYARNSLTVQQLNVNQFNHAGLTVLSPNWIVITDEDSTELAEVAVVDDQGAVTINLSDTVSTNFLVVRKENFKIKVNFPKNPIPGQVTSFNLVTNPAELIVGDDDDLNVSFAGLASLGAGFKYLFSPAKMRWYRMV